MALRSVALLALSLLGLSSGCGSDGNAAVSTLCGNGRLDPGERCDDGNLTDGDNCDSRCGSMLVDFRLSTNRCPVLRSLSVLPSVAPVGSDVFLTAQASDPDGDGIHYDWTGTGGLLSSPLHSRTATYTCGYPGTFVVSVWLFDSAGCVVRGDVTVICL